MGNAEDGHSAEQSSPVRSLEESLEELKQIVERMESGTQSLETSLDEFERGIKLVQECQQKLEQAEQRVRMLTTKGGGDSTEPFSSPQPD